MSESSTMEGFGVETPVQSLKELRLEPKEFIDQELSRGESIDLSAFPTILSQADVIARTGANIGELVAKIQLPYKNSPFITEEEAKARQKPTQLYCFKSTDASVGKHSIPTYIVLGAEQFQDMIKGQNVDDNAMLRFTEKGQTVDVGRGNWLPDVVREYPNDALKKDAIYRRNPAVSREQGSFTLNADGHLLFAVSENAKEENTVTVSRAPKDAEEVRAKVKAMFS